MDDEIDPKKELIVYLQYNEDIWDPAVFNNEEFDKYMMDLLAIPVRACHSVKFYNHLIGKKEEEKPKTLRKKLNL